VPGYITFSFGDTIGNVFDLKISADPFSVSWYSDYLKKIFMDLLGGKPKWGLEP